MKKDQIYQICNTSFKPDFLEVVDFSMEHRGHVGVGNKNEETHFLIKIKSSCFKNKTILESHKMIYKALDDLIKNDKIHALQIVIK